jgi:hypothetical protein
MLVDEIRAGLHAEIFHDYHQALTENSEGPMSVPVEQWDDLPQLERDRPETVGARFPYKSAQVLSEIGRGWMGLLTAMVISARDRTVGFRVGVGRTARFLDRLRDEMNNCIREFFHDDHVSKNDSDAGVEQGSRQVERRPIWDDWSWPEPRAEEKTSVTERRRRPPRHGLFEVTL